MWAAPNQQLYKAFVTRNCHTHHSLCIRRLLKNVEGSTRQYLPSLNISDLTVELLGAWQNCYENTPSPGIIRNSKVLLNFSKMQVHLKITRKDSNLLKSVCVNVKVFWPEAAVSTRFILTTTTTTTTTTETREDPDLSFLYNGESTIMHKLFHQNSIFNPKYNYCSYLWIFKFTIIQNKKKKKKDLK